MRKSQSSDHVDLSKVVLLSAEARPDLQPKFAELSAPIWPRFLDGDEAIIKYWDELYAPGLSRYQFAAIQVGKGGRETVLATSNSIPFAWPQPDDDATLPDGGWDEVLRSGVIGATNGMKGNALSALSIVVTPNLRGSNLAERLLRNMKTCAIDNDLQALVAPVRPTKKASYPLTSFDEYMAWTTTDGAPFDPWVRKHVHLGGRTAKAIHRSMVVRASLPQWTEWTGLRFPVSGHYHVEGGLAPVVVDRTANVGLYEEPSIWLRHPF